MTCLRFLVFRWTSSRTTTPVLQTKRSNVSSHQRTIVESIQLRACAPKASAMHVMSWSQLGKVLSGCALKGDSDWAHCETECHAHFASSEPHANATTTWGRDFDPFPRKKLFTMLAKSKVEAVLQMWRDGSFSFTLTRCKRVNNIQQSTHFPSELMPGNWEEGSLEKGSLSSRG